MTVRTKLIVAGIVLAAAVGYLATAAARTGWVYYLEVDHFVADQQYQSQRVRLHGKVATDRFEASPAAMSARFDLLGKSQTIAVQYRGAIPDMFEAGRDVVVEGRLDRASHTFQADVLMTKCASKYEPSSPHNTTAGGAKPETLTAAAKERAS